MSFERPTLLEIVARVQADFISRLELTGAVLRRSVVAVFARVVAGAAHMLHGHLDYLARQLFADTSELEFLERQGATFGITKNAPEFATGNLVIWGTNTTVIPISTIFLRADGAEYTTNAEVTIATLTAWVNTTAYTVGQLRRNNGIIYQCTVAGTSAGSGGPTGTTAAITDGTVTWSHVATGTAAVVAALTASVADDASNADAETNLTFESPIAGANSDATVAVNGLAGGTDEEEEEDYRTRVLERMRSPPHGGSEDDYIAWAKEVAGVTRVWVYPEELGAGTVVVRFVRDDDASLIPSAGEVTTVQDYIDERRPVTAAVTVTAPTAAALALTMAVLPNTTAVQDAVEAELTDLMQREAEPGVTLELWQIRQAIGNAEGLTSYTLATPAADVTHTTNQIATLGVVTFT